MSDFLREHAESLDGFAACNLKEPSPGDLERIYAAYQKAWADLAAYKVEVEAKEKELRQWYKFKRTVYEPLLDAVNFAYELGKSSYPLGREDQNKMLDALWCAKEGRDPKTRKVVTP